MVEGQVGDEGRLAEGLLGRNNPCRTCAQHLLGRRSKCDRRSGTCRPLARFLPSRPSALKFLKSLPKAYSVGILVDDRAERNGSAGSGGADETLSPLSRISGKPGAYHQRQSRCPLEPVLGVYIVYIFFPTLKTISFA